LKQKGGGKMAKATAQDLVRVIRTARQFFLQVAGTTGCDCINGFGITFKKVKGKRTKQPAIVFYVNRKLSLRNLPVQNRIPKQINIPWEHSRDGVLEVVTDVQPVRFQIFENVSRQRPCPGGYSIGHVDITAGTLGCWVKDRTTGEAVLLSNNHVLANSNNAAIGDPILQPGPHDGGSDPADRFATLTRFHPIDFTPGASNVIDAAIATPVDPAFVAPDIKDIGNNIPKETRNITVADLGQFVQKSGRTTEHTTGYIDTVNTTVTVKYGMFEKATFVDQIVIEAALSEEDISAGGDSGSAVLDRNKKLIGLLFAGSERDEGAGQPATAIINPIKHVFSLLNLETL
jgi:hypothetical protein